MEFLKTIKRRSFLSEVVYITLNIGLAVILMFIIRSTGSLWMAFAMVLLSQWRVFAVRPRFWFAHIQANLLGTIVSISFVVFLYVVNTANVSSLEILSTQIFLSLLYIIWLVFIKPQSKRVYIIIQASIALFSGITAIYYMSYSWVASPVVALVWLVGYSTARHILSNYNEESHTTLLSIIWGLMFAEIGWLAYHWVIAYRLPLASTLLLPQISIIVLCFGFLGYKIYDSYAHHQKIRLNDVLLPIFFSISIIGILIFVFNSVNTGIV